MSTQCNMQRAFERSQAQQAMASHKFNVVQSTGGLDMVLALHPDRTYPDPVVVREADRPGSRIASRLSPECARYAGAEEADVSMAIQIRQFARLAGISPNGTDYSKPQTARGTGEPGTVVKGPDMEVRFLAHWRNGYNDPKAKAAAVRREDKAMRFHFPYMLDGESRWRTPRVLADGRYVYGRDKVECSVLLERYRNAETAKQDQTDADARRVREVELAELVRLQREDMLAQRRGKVAKRDRTIPETSMGLAMREAGLV